MFASINWIIWFRVATTSCGLPILCKASTTVIQQTSLWPNSNRANKKTMEYKTLQTQYNSKKVLKNPFWYLCSVVREKPTSAYYLFCPLFPQIYQAPLTECHTFPHNFTFGAIYIFPNCLLTAGISTITTMAPSNNAHTIYSMNREFIAIPKWLLIAKFS